MVVLLDLDEGGCDDPFIERGAPVGFASSKLLVNGSVTKTPNSTTVQIERPNPNLNGVSAALGCYPSVPLPTFLNRQQELTPYPAASSLN